MLIKVSHSASGSSTTNTRLSEKNVDILRDSLENLEPEGKNLKRQYIYDEKLKCYIDPETDEYFEPRTP